MKAMLCVGGCKALRWRMQSFAWTIAMLCVRVGLNWHRKVCPILDKIKGGKTHPTGHLAPRKFLLNRYPPLLLSRLLLLQRGIIENLLI